MMQMKPLKKVKPNTFWQDEVVQQCTEDVIKNQDKLSYNITGHKSDVSTVQKQIKQHWDDIIRKYEGIREQLQREID